MDIEQRQFTQSNGWQTLKEASCSYDQFRLVLAFGSRKEISQSKVYKSIQDFYPNAIVLMCSTAGEILGKEVCDDSISLTALHFEKTTVRTACADIESMIDSYSAGKYLAHQLNDNKLVNIIIISDGQKVNGSELVDGLNDHLPKNVLITGGLAADGNNFKKTLVGLNEQPSEGKIAAIGFYGDYLHVRHGSMGGWDPFGPSRLITKSNGSTLYELDGKPALDIYKRYLGDYAGELPGSGLLFPLSIRSRNTTNTIVRTILSVDEEQKSLLFAGTIPEGSYAQMMKANFDRLIDGAAIAAQDVTTERSPEFALLISCVGRKLVLGQRTEEEIEAVTEILGEHTATAGFYSYGEIAPGGKLLNCELHNQTMTITAMTEL